MTVSYPATVPTVNASALSFHRWLTRWHAQTGRVDASTAYFARKQGKSERTVYRWLSELREAQMIACEVVEGIQRSITPLPVPPGLVTNRKTDRSARKQVTRGRKHKYSGQSLSTDASLYETAPTQNVRRESGLYEVAPEVSGVMSGVRVRGNVRGLPIDARTQETQQTQEAAPVVASLAQEGITATTAAQLVAEAGAEEARKQLEALPYRKAKDRAAVLVASIRQRWDVPRAYVEAIERKKREAQREAQRAAAAALAAKRAEQRAAAETRLCGLPGAVLSDLEARARASLAGTLAWRMASKSGGVFADKLLRAKMLELVQEVRP